VFIVFCNLKEVQCAPSAQILEDDSFSTQLTPGKYRISINSFDGGQALGWYSEKGMVVDGNCASVFVVPGEQESSIIINLQTTFVCFTP